VEVVADSLSEVAAVALKGEGAGRLFIEPDSWSRELVRDSGATASGHPHDDGGQLRRWVESGSSDPRVAIKKARLAELLVTK
jgi:hypothetical protein